MTRSCPDFVSYEDHQTPPRSMPPQDVTDEEGNYLGLDNIADQMIGMELVLDEGELTVKNRDHRGATGEIISRCFDADGRLGS